MVLKSSIQISVTEQRNWLRAKDVGLHRESLPKIKLSPKHILIITGIRRCGKSTAMHQLIKQKITKCAFFNFEDPRVFGFEVSDFPKLVDVMGSEAQFYFFDEIQNVPKWELFIRNLHDKNKTICITGSNASLLSKELGSRLTGRNIQVELFPFSYLEYTKFTKQKLSETSFNNYIKEGGFPDYITSKSTEVLHQLFKDIIFRDIIVRHGIRNAKVFIDIALFLISNAAKEYSLTKIKNAFNVGSTNSVVDYVQWLEDSYILFSLPKFSWSPKSVAINARKIYTIDTAFARANSLSFTEDTGRLLENAVYLHLRRSYKDLYYFKEKNECDFVVKEKEKVTMVFQVCSSLNDDNMKRETTGIVEAMHFFNLKMGIILTTNQEDELNIDGKKIKLIPVFKWMSINFK